MLINLLRFGFVSMELRLRFLHIEAKAQSESIFRKQCQQLCSMYINCISLGLYHETDYKLQNDQTAHMTWSESHGMGHNLAIQTE